MSILEHDERNHTQEGSEQSQDETGILTADIVEEGAGEQGSDGTQGVSHQTLTSNGRRSTVTVAIGRVAVSALKDEIDTESNGSKSNDGSDPGEEGVLREGVDEETDGQPDGTEHGSVETVLGHDLDVGVVDEVAVLAHLGVVGDPAQECSDSEGDVGQSRDTLGPTALLREGDGNDRQEQEDHSPAESDPETKGKDDGLGDQHADSLDGRGLEHSLQVGSVDIVLSHVSLIASGLAELLGARVQAGAATSLWESNEDKDQEGNVGETLDTLNPAPAKALVNEAGVDGGGNSTEDGDETEHGHGATALVRLVHVVKGTSNQDGTNTTAETEQQTETNDGVDVLGQCQSDEEQREAQEGTGVHNLAADQLAKGGEHHGRDSTGKVESEETELTHDGGNAKVLTHAVDTGTVSRGCQTNEQCHQVQQCRDTSLVPRIPVERVLLIARGKCQDNVFLVIVLNHLGQRQWHVDVHGLDGTAVRINVFVLCVDIFSTHDSSNHGFTLFVADDFRVHRIVGGGSVILFIFLAVLACQSKRSDRGGRVAPAGRDRSAVGPASSHMVGVGSGCSQRARSRRRRRK